MHIISRKLLRDFWLIHTGAETPLRAWLREAENADWNSFAEIREAFPSADKVQKYVVFNISGNKFRLVVVVHYNRGKIYVRDILTHAEYSRGRWKVR
jgi:mRNA interferase HigB